MYFLEIIFDEHATFFDENAYICYEVNNKGKKTHYGYFISYFGACNLTLCFRVFGNYCP
jgi:hypothetical protein